MTAFAGSLSAHEVGGRLTGYPCEGTVTLLMGTVDALHPNGHGGSDIGAPQGAPIYCPAAGIVYRADVHAIFGNHVILAHPDGDYTLYAHMESPPMISTGESVSVGQMMGQVGSTGLSTGPHLHWGMSGPDNPDFYLGGSLMDPLLYLEGDMGELKDAILNLYAVLYGSTAPKWDEIQSMVDEIRAKYPNGLLEAVARLEAAGVG